MVLRVIAGVISVIVHVLEHLAPGLVLASHDHGMHLDQCALRHARIVHPVEEYDPENRIIFGVLQEEK